MNDNKLIGLDTLPDDVEEDLTSRMYLSMITGSMETIDKTCRRDYSSIDDWQLINLVELKLVKIRRYKKYFIILLIEDNIRKLSYDI